ncbi:MAG: purine-nucleoside phosphorylase [Oscillospiraceae bacterium]|nr:purine-nucleoside phosphorylase [Oscillospiraceae bacterium]
MNKSMQLVQDMAQSLREHVGDFSPQVVLVLGSGLGEFAELVENVTIVPYTDVAHMPQSTAPGHAGNFVFGMLEGKRVVVMQGRPHYYEGHDVDAVVLPLRALRLMGASAMIVTNAAGGVNTKYNTCDLMLIVDHIKLFTPTPLRGANLAEFGTRFPDMTYAYSPKLREIACKVASDRGIKLHEGVYMYFPGPQFETPAEVRAARVLGADAVGMSTVYEVIAAVHAGYHVMGVSVISNMAAGVLPVKLSGDDVNEAAEVARPYFAELILGCLRDMP